MSEETKGKKPVSGKRRAISLILFLLAAVLLVLAALGQSLRSKQRTIDNLNTMRENAVLHAASGGLIDSIANQASSDKLKELRADKNFRRMGLNEVNSKTQAAADEARAEAEKLYMSIEVTDHAAMTAVIDELGGDLEIAGNQEEKERSAYSEMYVELIDTVPDWTDLRDGAADEDALFDGLVSFVPDLGKEENAHLRENFLKLSNDKADKEQIADEAEALNMLTSSMVGAVGDFTEYSGMGDDEIWAALTELLPELEESGHKDELLAAAKEHIAAAEKGETIEEPVKDEGVETTYGTLTDYSYFAESPELSSFNEKADKTYQSLWSILVGLIPDLEKLDNKMANTMRENIEHIVWPGSDDFYTRYEAYIGQGGAEALTGSDARNMTLAADVLRFLVAGLAVLLFALAFTFWKGLVKQFGVPRTIIFLFFVYLCLAAVLYNISVPMMLGNVLERFGMYGILVLAMLPGIQCGIGLNMGMTIGCIAGLLGIVLSLQFDMIGIPALVFACAAGALISVPLGFCYSKLLNRMKGSEMTISTYVGFSFVSLMCIGWMMLPFNTRKIIWLLSGHGLRVTHSLLGSFAHILDKFAAFKVFGMEVPTGVILFVLLFCFLMWIFSRTRTGIAMTAAGSNPRFAEASGINVDQMRTIGTMLSTVLAAVGIVIYSQAFGYAQLYTAPRQLGFIAASAILIGGATVSKAKVSHVIVGTLLFEGVLVLGQQIANSVVAGGGLSEVMRVMISNGIILYALTQSGGGKRE